MEEETTGDLSQELMEQPDLDTPIPTRTAACLTREALRRWEGAPLC